MHSDRLHAIHSSDVNLLIKCRRMRWAGKVARMGKREVHTGFWWENLRKRHHFQDIGAGGRITLKWLRNK